jgi:putative addiction module killer protein
VSEEPWEIRIYTDKNGTCPFDNWFLALDTRDRMRVSTRLDRVSAGNFGDHKFIGEGLYELRFFFGPGYRIYYAIAEKQVILLLIGGDKKKQSRDIQRAQQLWALHKNNLEK